MRKLSAKNTKIRRSLDSTLWVPMPDKLPKDLLLLSLRESPSLIWTILLEFTQLLQRYFLSYLGIHTFEGDCWRTWRVKDKLLILSGVALLASGDFGNEYEIEGTNRKAAFY